MWGLKNKECSPSAIAECAALTATPERHLTPTYRRVRRAHRPVGVLVGARSAPYAQLYFPRQKEETPDRVCDLGFRIGA